MSCIGTFARTADGFAGRLELLTAQVDLFLVPASFPAGGKAPDYRIRRASEDGREIGVGWNHTGEKAGAYVSLVLDDPRLSRPIRANLFRSEADDGTYQLYWTRQTRREREGQDR